MTLQNQLISSNITLLLSTADSEQTTEVYNSQVNIWNEPKEDNLLYEGNTLIAATLNKLIEECTSGGHHDNETVQTFLLTYGIFASHELVFSKLVERFNIPSSVTDDKTRKTIQFRVCVFLKFWIERHIRELWNRPIIKLIYDFIENKIQDTELKSMVEPLKRTITDSITKSTESVTFPSLTNDFRTSEVDSTKFDEDSIAKYLTFQTSLYYSKLQDTEFFNRSWENPKTQYMAPNILSLIDQFNLISRWVTTQIVSEKKLRKRAKKLESFIKIAKCLRDLNNFHILMAFISGLNNAAVSRLKYTKDKIPKNIFQIWTNLEMEMQFTGSFKLYRAALFQVKPPAIPYLGVHLQDLVFIEDGNPSRIGNLINWRKCNFVGGIVAQLQLLRTAHYNLEIENPHEYERLFEFPKLSDRELYSHSLECEGKDALRADIK